MPILKRTMFREYDLRGREADDELTHAKKLQEYITDFNILPTIPKAEINHTFDNLIDKKPLNQKKLLSNLR